MPRRENFQELFLRFRAYFVWFIPDFSTASEFHARNTVVKSVMEAAGIVGSQACPKGLRHGFGIACAEKNVPVSLIRQWLGHASIETTMIYLDAVGKEEREFAKRTWIT